MRYVIIGGGITGTTCAQELKKLDSSALITLVSEESHALYSRVLLPHYVKGKVQRERVFLKHESWYEEQEIEWIRGEQVTRLDPKNHFVEISCGREIEYDKVLIATGGELKTLEGEPRGVSYMRTLDDTDHFAQLLNERDKHTRAGIYGGGFIACEYLNIFAHYKIPTCIAFRGPHFWSSTLAPEAGALINLYLIEQGVDLHPIADFKEMIGEKELEGFSTTLGQHACSILGVGVGIAPDFSFLEGSGVDVGHGVKTNEYLETNQKDVYAAGDVAEFFDVVVGRHVRVGNWMNAQMQGRAVAKFMVGERTPFNLVSSYATNALGLEIIFVGDTSRSHAESIKILGSLKSGGVTQLFKREGKLVGGIMIGRNRDRMRVTEAIKIGSFDI
jgi:NAD(P)H-nitrite reductase large subunit